MVLRYVVGLLALSSVDAVRPGRDTNLITIVEPHAVVEPLYPVLSPEDAKKYPKLHKVLEMANKEPAKLAKDLHSLFHDKTVFQGWPGSDGWGAEPEMFEGGDGTPIVVAHGMGDSCFNPGMKQITSLAGQHLNVSATCIPTGDSQITDTIDGFLKNMDKSVDYFAAKVKADPKLANGFNAFGLSQGNNVIRGYITRYNDPPVKTFMSICGVNAGENSITGMCPPGGIPIVSPICDLVDDVLGDLAFTKIVQDILFQANFWRNPEEKKLNSTSFKANSQLAQWNGEGNTDMTQFKANWAKTDGFVWVKGTLDTVVWPKEGEWWGAPDPSDPYKKVLDMKDTRWYKEDLFGLKTADDAGKNHFESFVGEHIRFTTKELYAWLDKYFK